MRRWRARNGSPRQSRSPQCWATGGRGRREGVRKVSARSMAARSSSSWLWSYVPAVISGLKWPRAFCTVPRSTREVAQGLLHGPEIHARLPEQRRVRVAEIVEAHFPRHAFRPELHPALGAEPLLGVLVPPCEHCARVPALSRLRLAPAAGVVVPDDEAGPPQRAAEVIDEQPARIGLERRAIRARRAGRRGSSPRAPSPRRGTTASARGR